VERGVERSSARQTENGTNETMKRYYCRRRAVRIMTRIHNHLVCLKTVRDLAPSIATQKVVPVCLVAIENGLTCGDFCI
jgi:hypothetical protein